MLCIIAYVLVTLHAALILFQDRTPLLWQHFLQPVLAFAAALVSAVLVLGARRSVVFLVLSLGLTFLLEATGVATGWIYGSYHYSNMLGPLLLGLVPAVVPLFWFTMLLPSYAIALRLAPRPHTVVVAALSALAMVSWDLSLDPLMVHRGHWVWETQGDYYGVPLQNYLGWWITAFVVVLLYRWVVRRISEEPENPERLALYLYTAVAGGTVLSAFAAGLYGPAAVGVSALFWPLKAWVDPRPPITAGEAPPASPG